MRSRREIEDCVQQLLRKHHISQPPVPVDAIATAEGLPILETSLAGDVSGALVRSRGLIGIAVNSQHHPNRRRFTIAHELAHFLLNHEGKENHIDWQFTVIRRDGVSSEASDSQEMEANFFAATLLMPKELIRSDLAENLGYNGEPSASESEIQKLARKYQVSDTALRYRLMNLGLLSML
jgi:Zn-dependent peptidase ImmA (M78 family)